MDIQVTSAVIGVTCLAFAAIGTFLLIPDRELTVREKIGIHTIFWVFVIYAAWIIYTQVWVDKGWTTWDKYFYISVPLLLGLLLSLLAEFTSKQPPLHIENQRIRNITSRTWGKLPNNVKRALQRTIMNILEVPEWSELDEDSSKPGKPSAARWFPILPFPARGIIHISVKDCESLSDDVIAGTLASQMARAYQSTRTPFDNEAIDNGAETLPPKWHFKTGAPGQS